MTDQNKDDNKAINEWPYPDIAQRWYAGDHTWRETNYEAYLDQLGAVPPVKMTSGAFMVGEPHDHNELGAVCAAFVEINTPHNDPRYFCRLDNVRMFDVFKYRNEIKLQFNLSEV